MGERVRIEKTNKGAAILAMARPHLNNAFDDAAIREMTKALRALEADATVDAVVIAGDGKNFCAGADIEWMRRAASQGFDENLADAMALAELMSALDRLSKPTIARIQGAVYGGGVGLVACCDIAIASDDSRFCLSEVKLGIVPAVIGPYVIAAIGARAARRYFQTAEVFDAARAEALGLVHEVVPQAEMDKHVHACLESLAQGAPGAKAASKALVHQLAGRAIDQSLGAETARIIAQRRATAEAQEGLSAFLEKRAPKWRKHDR
jgi:methylglutaconyl-CoA hydratase